MRRILIIALALGVCTRAANAAEQKTLAECIAIAIAQHPSLKAAGASVQAGGQRVREAAANYLPQITGSYNATRQRSSVAPRTSSNTRTSVLGQSAPQAN